MKIKYEIEMKPHQKETMRVINNIAHNAELKLEFTEAEMEYLIKTYIRDKIDLDLDEENIDLFIDVYLILDTKNIENDYKEFVFKMLSSHFGKSVFANNSDKYDCLNIIVALRKIFKHANFAFKDGYILVVYEDYEDYYNSWAEKYLIKEERNEEMQS